MGEEDLSGLRGENVSVYEKWKRAVVHIMPARNRMPLEESIEKTREIQKKQKNGLLGPDEASDALRDLFSRNERYTGTAIFIKHDSRRYLVTARHVVHDEKHRLPSFSPQPTNEKEQRFMEEVRKSDEERMSTSIYNMIFLVPTLNDLASNPIPVHEAFLMNLMAGPYDMAGYTYSQEDLDIAVISLDHRTDTERFAETLTSRGYKPVSLEDISDGPANENSEVFSVGYPLSVSTLRALNLHPAEYEWQANILSLPVFSHGHIAMLHPQLPHFWCDLSIYPGSSGGPVLENGRMVGIVLAQASLNEEIRTDDNAPQEGHVESRLPFARAVKAEFVKKTLEEQESKTRSRSEWKEDRKRLDGPGKEHNLS